MEYNTTNEILEAKVALQVTTDNKVKEIAPENGTDFSLEEFYKYTDCDCIENVYLPNNKIMVVDEEGALRDNRVINLRACEILSDVNGQSIPIFGNVMVILQEQEK